MPNIGGGFGGAFGGGMGGGMGGFDAQMTMRPRPPWISPGYGGGMRRRGYDPRTQNRVSQMAARSFGEDVRHAGRLWPSWLQWLCSKFPSRTPIWARYEVWKVIEETKAEIKEWTIGKRRSRPSCSNMTKRNGELNLEIPSDYERERHG